MANSKETKCPFKSVGHALSYYNLQNPARARYVNFFEIERFQKAPAEDFSGESPRDIWAAIVLAIGRTVNGLDSDRYWAFIWRNVGDRAQQLSVEEIAGRLGRSPRTIRRYLRETTDDLEDELIRRELVPPREYEDDNTK